MSFRSFAWRPLIRDRAAEGRQGNSVCQPMLRCLLMISCLTFVASCATPGGDPARRRRPPGRGVGGRDAARGRETVRGRGPSPRWPRRWPGGGRGRRCPGAPGAGAVPGPLRPAVPDWSWWGRGGSVLHGEGAGPVVRAPEGALLRGLDARGGRLGAGGGRAGAAGGGALPGAGRRGGADGGGAAHGGGGPFEGAGPETVGRAAGRRPGARRCGRPRSPAPSGGAWRRGARRWSWRACASAGR